MQLRAHIIGAAGPSNTQTCARQTQHTHVSDTSNSQGTQMSRGWHAHDRDSSLLLVTVTLARPWGELTLLLCRQENAAAADRRIAPLLLHCANHCLPFFRTLGGWREARGAHGPRRTFHDSGERDRCQCCFIHTAATRGTAVQLQLWRGARGEHDAPQCLGVAGS